MPDVMLKTMKDRGTFWEASPDWTSAAIERDGWSARPVLGLSRVMVSGNLDAALAEVAPGTASVGLWQIAQGPVQAVRIARDRLLLVSERKLAAKPGWSDAGFAASIVDDAWATLEISGEDLRELVAEMTLTDLDQDSPSAATLACGLMVLMHRTRGDTARIHLEAPLATTLWHWLERR